MSEGTAGFGHAGHGGPYEEPSGDGVRVAVAVTVGEEAPASDGRARRGHTVTYGGVTLPALSSRWEPVKAARMRRSWVTMTSAPS